MKNALALEIFRAGRSIEITGTIPLRDGDLRSKSNPESMN
jgi:hypothetical protein